MSTLSKVIAGFEQSNKKGVTNRLQAENKRHYQSFVDRNLEGEFNEIQEKIKANRKKNQKTC